MKFAILLMGLAVFLSGCSNQSKPPETRKVPLDVKAPSLYRVNFDTSRGGFIVEVTRDDAPLGADRFYNLVMSKFYDGTRFFRVVPGFVVQFGIAADPKVTQVWDVPFKDDPVHSNNQEGTLSFATSGPNSRTTQVFLNLGDNVRLDGMGFAAFGRVVSGMEVVQHIYAADGEKPDQHRIEQEGNAYLQKEFPNLDYVKTARIAQ